MGAFTPICFIEIFLFVPRLFHAYYIMLTFSSYKQFFLDNSTCKLDTFHDNFEDFVEFVGGEAFDVFGAGIKVASDVGEDGEMGVDGGCITFEDFKIRFLSRQPELIRSSSMMAWSKTVSTPDWALSFRVLIFYLLLSSSNFTYFIIMSAVI